MAAYFINNRNVQLEARFYKETEKSPLKWDCEYNCEEYTEEYTQWLENKISLA